MFEIGLKWKDFDEWIFGVGKLKRVLKNLWNYLFLNQGGCRFGNFFVLGCYQAWNILKWI
jgi:hypothetical protein